ncbi:hypothetical protein CDO26_19195 (plasmid) [Sinorhizobium meliloti]|nr:hypothetical protein CDO26_19195 [Sinorhizobium meliloti]ASP93471.1 hypothetical protein CDO25_19945 [Sinorhizobium meliloti]
MRIGRGLVLPWVGLCARALYREAPFVLARMACLTKDSGSDVFSSKNASQQKTFYEVTPAMSTGPPMADR